MPFGRWLWEGVLGDIVYGVLEYIYGITYLLLRENNIIRKDTDKSELMGRSRKA